jgi:phosphoserine phosphatase
MKMTYEEKRERLIQYLKMKVEEADWHGVSDAANDLRVLEAGEIANEKRSGGKDEASS